MARKAKKTKVEEKKEPPKPKIPVGYEVINPIWIRGIRRYPGYTLNQEDIGYLNSKGIFDHVINKIKAIKEIY